MQIMKKATFGSLILIVLVLAATSVLAQPDPNNCRFPSHIFVCPKGDAHIRAVIHDVNNLPISWPISMSFAGPAASSLYHAPGYSFPTADVVSQNGVVTFQPEIGGCEMAGGVRFVDGQNGNQLGSTITINSPDLNGDGSVNLSDVVIFSSVFPGPYNRCIDFNGDSVNDLVDVSLFVLHFGH